MKVATINMKTLAFSILIFYTIHCISNENKCDGQIYSRDKYYWGNSLQSRYLIGNDVVSAIVKSMHKKETFFYLKIFRNWKK